ncbi:hypothetical protein D9M72_490110 [compost metagenome]
MKHRIGKDQFARLDAQDIGEQTAFGGLGQPEDASGDIDPGKRVSGFGAALDARQRHQIVGFRRRQQFLFGDRARRHQAHDVAAHHRFAAALLGLRRVFDLLADCDAEAEADQLLQIIVGGMHRHAAHRNFLSHVLAALRQRDAERARRFDRVLEEQLVEVAHAVEQQRIRVVRLDLDELFHHRRCRGTAFLARQFGCGQHLPGAVRLVCHEIHDCSEKRDGTLSPSNCRRQP